MDEDALWIELGKAIRRDGLGMLPEEEDFNPSEGQVGRWYFERQLPNIRKIYCNERITQYVQNEQRRDVTEFVATLIDLFSAYFGVAVGTVILVKIYKIGVDRFCDSPVDCSKAQSA